MKTHQQLLDAFKAAGDRVCLIDFYTDWCGPCKAIAPHFIELSKEFTDVVFIKCHAEQNPESAKWAGVQGFPKFVFVQGGQIVGSFYGANKAKLRAGLTSGGRGLSNAQCCSLL